MERFSHLAIVEGRDGEYEEQVCTSLEAAIDYVKMWEMSVEGFKGKVYLLSPVDLVH